MHFENLVNVGYWETAWSFAILGFPFLWIAVFMGMMLIGRKKK